MAISKIDSKGLGLTTDLAVDTDTLVVDATNNRVGIGTSSPDSDIEIVNAATGGDFPTIKLTGNQSDSSTEKSGQIIFEKSTNASVQSIIESVGGAIGTHNSNLVFKTSPTASAGATERMRIDSSGNLLVGQSTSTTVDTLTSGSGYSFQSNGRAAIARTSGICLAVNRIGTDGDIIEFKKDGTQVGRIGTIVGYTYITDPSRGLRFFGNSIRPCSSGGSNLDNTIDLGSPTVRFNDAYVTNGVTSGSDKRLKQDIEELSEAERNVAIAAKGLLRKYRWKSAVEEKGDDARIHFGIIAQDLQAAFEAEGLDAGRYGMFIHTTIWEAPVVVQSATEAQDAVLDEEGNVIQEAVEAKDEIISTETYTSQEEAPEGAVQKDMMGIRYSELLAFIIAAL